MDFISCCVCKSIFVKFSYHKLLKQLYIYNVWHHYLIYMRWRKFLKCNIRINSHHYHHRIFRVIHILKHKKCHDVSISKTVNEIYSITTITAEPHVFGPKDLKHLVNQMALVVHWRPFSSESQGFKPVQPLHSYVTAQL